MLTKITHYFCLPNSPIYKPELILDYTLRLTTYYTLRPWSSWTANSDRKYMKLNGAALNVNKPCVTSRKTAFPKDK